ncbi:MAG: two-component system, response regulator PdtaR [Gaiellaceae bacterium]|nr:two-component system, response regulator PdtaR [Gaiellaceae bacterium]
MFDDRVRVLIAEDETIIRLDLRQMLEQNGVEVCGEARDGLEAIELARTTKPDVALFDMKMPKLDGVEAARRVYAERPMPIVMLTAYAEPELVVRAIGAGVFSYLTKPFEARDVLPAIQTAVARHEELLAARRDVGRAHSPLEVEVRSSSGQVWPLRLQRRPDGSVDVSLQGES